MWNQIVRPNMIVRNNRLQLGGSHIITHRVSIVVQMSASGLWNMVAKRWHLFQPVSYLDSLSWSSSETRAFVAWRSLFGQEVESILSAFDALL